MHYTYKYVILVHHTFCFAIPPKRYGAITIVYRDIHIFLSGGSRSSLPYLFYLIPYTLYLLALLIIHRKDRGIRGIYIYTYITPHQVTCTKYAYTITTANYVSACYNRNYCVTRLASLYYYIIPMITTISYLLLLLYHTYGYYYIIYLATN